MNAARPELVVIAALARDRVIGRDNALPWHLPEDLRHFKALTTGHTVIMGRKTWESLPERFRPLPGRTNVVVTRNPDYRAAGATVAGSLAEALKVGAGGMKSPAGVTAAVSFVIGGAELYAHALPLADRLELTEIAADFAGDAYFPAWNAADWEETARDTRRHAEGGAAAFDYAFVSYQRRHSPQR